MLLEVTIRLKKGVADPEGANTLKTLRLLGFSTLQEVKSLKTWRIEVDTRDPGEARRQAEEMCRRLLANPVIQDYEIRTLDGG
ncbi:MAG: phosphoribosylformylglycinamidine synthase subunit PurS [Euryarchaeota archaeon]|nr:phosphoribosylformylglycinamidine synthase subunit PurS [Euryarchaeota archaeon]